MLYVTQLRNMHGWLYLKKIFKVRSIANKKESQWQIFKIHQFILPKVIQSPAKVTLDSVRECLT